jgi:sarcosine oxidase
MSEVSRADVIVVGLGAAGSAVLYQLARRGVRAIGIDRYDPPHSLGSTHGESRITRLSVGEGAAYAPLVRRSHDIWRQIEAASGMALLRQTGLLLLNGAGHATRHHGTPAFFDRSLAIATQFAIPHEILDAAAIAARFPQFTLRGDETGLFEPSGGVLSPERCVAAQLRLAAEGGAVIRTGEIVGAISERDGCVEVITSAGRLNAAQVVVTAGPWLAGLLGGRFATLARPYRQVLHWFALAPGVAPAAYAPGRFPVFIWMHGADEEAYFYGFPVLPGVGAGMKVASARYRATTDPQSMARTVSEAESAEMHQTHVAGRLRGLSPRRTAAAACLYTVTLDGGFIVDSLPGSPHVLIVSACSGHGFKHSAALGEAVAERLTQGRSTIDLTPFGLARFA